jgi:hypothetical protein
MRVRTCDAARRARSGARGGEADAASLMTGLASCGTYGKVARSRTCAGGARNTTLVRFSRARVALGRRSGAPA